MKKGLHIIISVVLLLTFIPFVAFAEEKNDWEIYDNYKYYNNDERTKTSGYVVDSINVGFTDEFLSEGTDVVPSLFPEIADKIVKIGHFRDLLNNDKLMYVLYFAWNDPLEGNHHPYTEAEIDEFIGIVKYVQEFDFVESAIPTMVCSVVPLPVDPKDTEDNTKTEEDNTSEKTPGEENDPEDPAIDTVTEENVAGENNEVTSETEAQSSAPDITNNNKQTGDELIILAVASVLALTIAAVIIVRRKKA